MTGNWPSNSPNWWWTDKLSGVNERQEARKWDLSIWTKAALLSVALSVAAFINPLSSKSAQAWALTPWIAWSKVPGSDLLKNVSSWNPYETPIDISQVPSWFREDFKMLSGMLSSASWKKLITIEWWWEFIWKKTWIRWLEELWKVIYAVNTKTLRLWSFDQLTWVNLNDLVRDLWQNVNWNKTADEINKSITWKFLTSIIDNEDVLSRTLKSFSSDWWQNEISKWILDGKVYSEYQKLFTSWIETLQKRWLLTKETVYLVHRTSLSIAYQEALRYKENNWEVVYNWDESSVKPAWLKMWKNAWMGWREYLATEKSVRGLMMNPNFEAIVYRVKVSYEWKTTTVDFMLPTSQAEYVLWSQAIRHSIVWKDRWILASVVSSAWYSEETRKNIDKLIASAQEDTAESKKRIAESERRTVIMNEYLSIVKWKKIVELEPKLATIIDIRNRYAKVPWYDPNVLASYDELITMLKIKKS